MTIRRTSTRSFVAALLVFGLVGCAASMAFGQSSDDSDRDDATRPPVCADDHTPNYVEFAERYLEGDEEGRVPERAVEVLTNGCDREDAASCERLADLYEEGVGVDKDAERAEELRDRADRLRE